MLWLSEDAIQYAVSRCSKCNNYKVIVACKERNLRQKYAEFIEKLCDELDLDNRYTRRCDYINTMSYIFPNKSQIDIIGVSDNNIRGRRCHLLIASRNTNADIVNSVLRPFEIEILDSIEIRQEASRDWHREYDCIFDNTNATTLATSDGFVIDEDEFDKILDGASETKQDHQNNIDYDIAIEKINRLSRKRLEKWDVYLFDIVLCNNEIDKDFDVFSENALNKLSKFFIGKTGMIEHDKKYGDEAARIYDTEIVRLPGKTTSYGEPYVELKAYVYIVKKRETTDLITAVDSGVFKEASVGCSVSKSVCSICGEDTTHKECDHIKGKEYNGKMCYNLLEDPTDAYEWSFVVVPKSRIV